MKTIITSFYDSPVGKLLIAVEEDGLIGVWIENQKYYFPQGREKSVEDNDNPTVIAVKDWLDRYFAGKKPEITELKLAPKGSEFRQKVWKILCEIPYGKTITYGEIAGKIASEKNLRSMSAQAVGGAVGHNPISIIIPCHRVVGSDGSLTGYAGGVEKKKMLLEFEKENSKEN